MEEGRGKVQESMSGNLSSQSQRGYHQLFETSHSQFHMPMILRSSSLVNYWEEGTVLHLATVEKVKVYPEVDLQVLSSDLLVIAYIKLAHNDSPFFKSSISF